MDSNITEMRKEKGKRHVLSDITGPWIFNILCPPNLDNIIDGNSKNIYRFNERYSKEKTYDSIEINQNTDKECSSKGIYTFTDTG